MAITAEQSRAARALIGWAQDELAEKSGVAKRTIADFERGARTPQSRTLRDIVATLEEAGIIFIAENGEGPGVRLKKQ